jgi:hypothetical protein
MTIATIVRGNGTTNKNGEGNLSFVQLCLAADYGRAAARETKTANEITAIAEGPEFIKYEGVTVKFKVASNGDVDAKHFNTEGEIFIPAITEAKSTQLGDLVNHPIVLICEDRSGNIRKIGQQDDGVQCDIEEMTEGKNGILLKFKIEGQPFPPAFIDAIATIPVPA